MARAEKVKKVDGLNRLVYIVFTTGRKTPKRSEENENNKKKT